MGTKSVVFSSRGVELQVRQAPSGTAPLSSTIYYRVDSSGNIIVSRSSALQAGLD